MELEWRSGGIERLSIAHLLTREIRRISDNRVAHLPEMHPDLIGSTGAEVRF
jgi:hypothetical protein